jgi:hypothetical protein
VIFFLSPPVAGGGALIFTVALADESGAAAAGAGAEPSAGRIFRVLDAPGTGGGAVGVPAASVGGDT